MTGRLDGSAGGNCVCAHVCVYVGPRTVYMVLIAAEVLCTRIHSSVSLREISGGYKALTPLIKISDFSNMER